MSRTNPAILFTVIIVAIGAPPASAQLGFDTDPGLLEFGAAYALAQSGSGDTMDGGGFGINFESVQARGRFSLGTRFAFFGTEDTETLETGERVDLYYRSMPIYLIAKLFVGDPASRFLGYVGFGPGVSFNRLETRATAGYFAEQKTSIGLGLPVGVTVAVSRNAYLTAGYSLQFVGGSFFDHDLVHAFGLGLGFKQ